jgi:hypothetical protein
MGNVWTESSYCTQKKLYFVFHVCFSAASKVDLVWLIQKWGLTIGGIYFQEYQIMKILQNIEQIIWHGKILNKDWRKDFINVNEKTGTALSEEITKKIQSDGLKLCDIQGQGSSFHVWSLDFDLYVCEWICIFTELKRIFHAVSTSLENNQYFSNIINKHIEYM